MEYRFYHMTRTALNLGILKILQKSLQQHKRVLVYIALADGEQQEKAKIEELSKFLWGHDVNITIPHGSDLDHMSDDEKKLNPIWITRETYDPIGADYIFVLADRAIDLSALQGGRDYALLARFFHKNWEESVIEARHAWKDYKAQGCAMTYFQEKDEGGWQKLHELNMNKT